MNSGITLVGGVEIPERVARAHAMKNCLGVILAVTRLVEPELSEEGRSRIGRLEAAVWRLRDLLHESLTGRESDSRRPTPSSPASVTTIVHETIERVADRAAEASVELFVQCGGGDLSCDAVALREALFNLVANAIEASPPGSGVFVATYPTSEGGQHWVVNDMGRGIAPDRVAGLGRPYHTTKVGGSGLGLAIARSAVDAQGGTLEVESSPTRGTTVSIWLPRQP